MAGGSTSLYNAIYISLKDLKKVPAKDEQDIRRQAIILLSDGEDTSSAIGFDDVMDLARRSETAIYPIGLMADESAQSKGFREATYALRQLATDTGGRVFFPTDVKSPGVDLRPDLRRAVEPVHHRLHVEEYPA